MLCAWTPTTKTWGSTKGRTRRYVGGVLLVVCWGVLLGIVLLGVYKCVFWRCGTHCCSMFQGEGKDLAGRHGREQQQLADDIKKQEEARVQTLESTLRAQAARQKSLADETQKSETEAAAASLAVSPSCSSCSSCSSCFPRLPQLCTNIRTGSTDFRCVDPYFF